MKKRIRVLVVDDHAMVRMGLNEAIAAEPDMQLAGEAADGFEAIEQYQKNQPHVVLMDYQMPNLDGVQATAQLRKKFPEASIVLLSIREGQEDIWRAHQAGVRGYLPKSAPMNEVLAAVRQVHAGKDYFPPEITAKIKLRAGQSGLTSREADVLRLIVGGKCNKEISTLLDLSLIHI